MALSNFRDFLDYLEQHGELKRITYPVNPYLEMTEIADRVLRSQGPALLFENPIGYDIPVLCNLFGTAKRVAMAMGREETTQLREIGELLAFLREPEPPKGIRQFFNVLPKYKQVLNMPWRWGEKKLQNCEKLANYSLFYESLNHLKVFDNFLMFCLNTNKFSICR